MEDSGSGKRDHGRGTGTLGNLNGKKRRDRDALDTHFVIELEQEKDLSGVEDGFLLADTRFSIEIFPANTSF